jgi:hypothetical protein
MVAISNIIGLHLSVEKKSIESARLAGTYELFSTVHKVDLPAHSPGMDPGAVRRFFQVDQQLSCRCVLRFEPTCSSGPCGGNLSIWRSGRWSTKVPYTYIGGGKYRWTNPPDRCGCYGAGRVPGTADSQVDVSVVATNQVSGKPLVFELIGRASSRWRLNSKLPGFPPQWRVIAAVDATPTDF